MLELHTPDQAAQWLHSRVTGILTTDSRKVRSGDGFIAWPGAATDGRQYVNAALSQGARACLVEKAGVEAYRFESERVAAYAELKAASGPIAASYYEQPCRQLDVLAVTGTNGKTSTSWWLAQALTELSPSIPCGLIGTLGVGRAPRAGAKEDTTANVVSTGLTTPDPVLLQQTLRRFVDDGLKACAIEASSIGIEERRLDGMRIRTAIFTNFTQDHLDYHGSMAAYWQAKAALFDWPDLAAAVINIDDEMGAGLARSLNGRALDVWTVSCKSPARLTARGITFDGQGLRFSVCEGETQIEMATHLIGNYNVSNLLEVIAAMRTLDVPLADCINACRVLHPVPGRMEVVSTAGPSQGGRASSAGSAAHGVASVGAKSGQPLAVVDYAHTPDALAQVLQALQPLARQRGGQLWCVFGCGGDRDPLKRPLMGAVAAQHADRVIVTSDNPRSEKAEAIISQILLGLEGVAGVDVEADRAQAIARTLKQAGAQDVVLVAGKGHEDYQEIAGVRQPFSDRAEVSKALQARANASAAGVAA
jgi:UDP-N-acetylmuramoyl-L-alanyl-D-glutamate--2,6-diaminopimelate ligase